MTPMAATHGPTGETTPDPERRTQLADLIRARRAELGESLDAFASRAIDPVSEVRVTRGWIYRLERGEKITPPVYEELAALASAARLPIERLQDAAGQQFHGVDPLRSGTGEATAYVRKLDALPPEQRERLLSLIDSLVPPSMDDSD
ncbi:helix-turn-helix transcriptional regulator [Streptomyces sp. NPDC002265]|uniref:helix-turn-helix domain-containing protein n=1 Tax=Streptomyces sp. NPDC002265 TaxID=3154415 RepID=UPI003332DAC4